MLIGLPELVRNVQTSLISEYAPVAHPRKPPRRGKQG